MSARMRELDPSSARGLYGLELRRHRLAVEPRLSLDRLALDLHRSKGFLSDIERAEVPIPPGLSEQLDDYFKTDGKFQRLWLPARHEAHPDRYSRFMALEARAIQIEEYAAHVVPGLLQTPEYARALIREGMPDATPDDVETKVDARLARQERLGRPRYWVILDEAVIRRSIGGAQVMADQLLSLLKAVAAKVVRVQVLSFSVGGHPTLGGAATVLTLPNRSLVAYLEGNRSGELIEDPEIAAEYEHSYDLLRALALNPRASEDLIRAAAKEFQSDDSRVAQVQLQQRRWRPVPGSSRPRVHRHPRP